MFGTIEVKLIETLRVNDKLWGTAERIAHFDVWNIPQTGDNVILESPAIPFRVSYRKIKACLDDSLQDVVLVMQTFLKANSSVEEREAVSGWAQRREECGWEVEIIK